MEDIKGIDSRATGWWIKPLPQSLVINTLLHKGGSLPKTIGFYAKGNDSEMEGIKVIDSRATGLWIKPLLQA